MERAAAPVHRSAAARRRAARRRRRLTLLAKSSSSLGEESIMSFCASARLRCVYACSLQLAISSLQRRRAAQQ
jgi:hypothetical protein